MEKSLLWIVFVPQYASESRARKGKQSVTKPILLAQQISLFYKNNFCF